MSADYAEIRVLKQGPTPELADLTLAVTFTFSLAAVERFKKVVPWRTDRTKQEQDRAWDEHGAWAEVKRWYVHPRHLETLKRFARDFDGAMLIDGERWEDLRTGRVWTQGTLFEGNANA